MTDKNNNHSFPDLPDNLTRHEGTGLYFPQTSPNFFKRYVIPYIPSYILIGMMLVTGFILEDIAATQMIGVTAIISTLIIYLSHHHNRKNIAVENLFTYPAFCVSAYGSITRCNQAGAEAVALYGTFLQDMLNADGFDDGSAYRLLSSKTPISLKNANIIYQARPLTPLKEYLVTRLERGVAHYPHAPASEQTSISENSSPDASPFLNSVGFFEKYNVSSSETSPQNDIATVNDTLKSWIKNDKELKDFLKQCDSSIMRHSHEQSDIFFENIAFIDRSGKDDITFRVMIKEDKDKTEGYIFPIAGNIINIADNKENLYAQVFNDSPMSVVITDKEGYIKDYNRAFFKLTQNETIYDSNIYDFFPQEYHEKIAMLHATGKAIEVPLYAQDNEKTVKLSVKNPISQEETTSFIYYVVDLSEEKSLEQKFNQIQKMQAVGQLAGGIAHDFNNLLTAILGHTELLLGHTSPTDIVFSDLIQIQQNANRAGGLVKQLLAFSRQQTLQPKIINLTDILPDICNLLRRLIGEKITLKTEYGRDLRCIKADSTQLERVIVNLAVNAKDAMNEGGVFHIQTENVSIREGDEAGYNIMPAGDYVGLYVSDTGCGMSPEICAKIFEPFFTTKDIGQGTGLGLSTVYGIVKQSDGFIFVESEVQKGTVFKIYFPTVSEEAPLLPHSDLPLITQKTVISSQDAPHTKTILVVEDEASVRALVVRALEVRGYNILEADSGEEALDIFKEHSQKIDLILSDVMMPGMDGPTWVREAITYKNNLKIIFMSGYAEDTFRNDPAMQADGLSATFLAKPFSLKDLNQIVKDNI